MTNLIFRLYDAIRAVVRPTGRSLVDVIFGGAHVDRDTVATDLGATSKTGARTDRLRPQRRDLAAALRADPTAPEHELTTWPPAPAKAEPCTTC